MKNIGLRITVIVLIIFVVLCTTLFVKSKSKKDSESRDLLEITAWLGHGLFKLTKYNIYKAFFKNIADYAWEEDVAGVKRCIAKGADVKYEHTALMNTSRFGNLEIVKVLVQNGTDIHATDINDQTALIVAEDNLRNDI